MCKFFSCNSDGKGNVIFFKVEDIAKEMAMGNPKSYDWNSHTSIASFHKIESAEEDKWNKWEYNPEKKELRKDILNTKDDSKAVKKIVGDYLKEKDIDYLRDLYNRNSGYCNSGNCNSGDYNSGYYNSGNYNSGYRNSGYKNSGYRNSGDYNSGYYNSGNYNSGDYNSGYYNSGYCNSGNYNSGYYNSGDGIHNSFCTKKIYLMFNEICSKEDADELAKINIPLEIIKWIDKSKMTKKEKTDNPSYKTTNGYLKIIDYKEAWKKVPKSSIAKIKKLKGFDKKIFEKITGL